MVWWGTDFGEGIDEGFLVIRDPFFYLAKCGCGIAMHLDLGTWILLSQRRLVIASFGKGLVLTTQHQFTDTLS